MPFFGIRSPLRLLREKWNSPQELSEELYSMLEADTPVSLESPLNIQATEGKTALKVKTDYSKPEPSPAAPPRTRRSTRQDNGLSQEATQSIAVPRPLMFDRTASAPIDFPKTHRTAAGLAQVPKVTNAYTAPVVDVEGEVAFRGPKPVQFDTPPHVFNVDTGNYQPLVIPPADYSKLKAGLQFIFWGVVQSGSGNTYKVALCAGGPSGTPDTSNLFTVTVPDIDPAETIPKGLLIGPIFNLGLLLPDELGIFMEIGALWYQPPIWIE